MDTETHTHIERTFAPAPCALSTPGSQSWIQSQRHRMWKAYEAGELDEAAKIAAIITASR